MKQFGLTCLYLLLSGILSAQPGTQERLLDSIFTMLHSQHQFNGSVLIAEKGKIVFRKGYGYRDESTRKLNDENTVFELASCSKQFTATAIVLLKRQGKLNYTDKLSDYIPELAHWDKVTINDLLRHTSGLPEYLVDMPEKWDKTRIATNDDLIRFYAARKDTLEFVPGSVHAYNNTNYALLASIVERVSGQSYAAFLAKHIFKPLRIKHTFVYNSRQHHRKLKNYAIGYTWARNSFTKVIPEDERYGENMVRYLDGIVGNAKVHSSVDDLYKWVIALRENTLLTQQEFEEITRVTTTSAGKTIRYGYGFDLSKGENKFAFGHNGSWGGYASLIYHDFLKDRTIITLQNFRMGVYPFENIMQVLNGQPLDTVYRSKISLTEDEIKKYAGTYTTEEDPEDEQIITCLDGYLVHNSKKIPWDLRFFPVTANEFQGIMKGGPDAVLRFTTLPDGHVKLEMLQFGELVGTGIRQTE